MRFSILLVAVAVQSVLARDASIWGGGDSPTTPLAIRDIGERDIAPLENLLSPVTNGERFKRGLPPLRPKTSLRFARALAPRTSSVPCTPLTSATGIIAVTRVSGGASVGYLSNTFDGQNSYTFTTSLASALTVSLPSTSPFNAPIDITAVSGPDPSHPEVGAVGGSGGYDFTASGPGYAYLAGTGHTNANSPPSSSAGTSIQVLGYNAPSESQIWTLSCTTLTFTAQWTNVDSTQPSTTIFYDPVVDYLGLTADLAAYNAAFGDNAYAVAFTFVPA